MRNVSGEPMLRVDTVAWVVLNRSCWPPHSVLLLTYKGYQDSGGHQPGMGVRDACPEGNRTTTRQMARLAPATSILNAKRVDASVWPVLTTTAWLMSRAG